MAQWAQPGNFIPFYLSHCGKVSANAGLIVLRAACADYGTVARYQKFSQQSRDTMAISNEADEGIDFSDIEEKCVLAIELTTSGIPFEKFPLGTRFPSKTALTTF